MPDKLVAFKNRDLSTVNFLGIEIEALLCSDVFSPGVTIAFYSAAKEMLLKWKIPLSTSF